MTQSCWASLGLPFTLSPRVLSWPLVFLLIGSYVPFVFSLGHPWPVCFLWASSSLLLNLHSHGLLLTSLDFPDPITSFSSLEFMGLPLTPYSLCMHYFWACSGSFSLFLNHILPMGMLFLSFRASLSPFTSSRPICLFYEFMIHHSCRLGLMALSLVCCPCCWAFCLPLGSSKIWPSTLVKVVYEIFLETFYKYNKIKKNKNKNKKHNWFFWQLIIFFVKMVLKLS